MLTLSSPNFFAFLSGDYNVLFRAGIYLTIAILGVGACLIIKRGITDNREIIPLAVWCNMICIYFLPAMHERYVFIACIFSIVWAFVHKKDWWIAVGINAVCFISYLYYLLANPEAFELKYLSIANLVLLIALSMRLFIKRFPSFSVRKEW